MFRYRQWEPWITRGLWASDALGLGSLSQKEAGAGSPGDCSKARHVGAQDGPTCREMMDETQGARREAQLTLSCSELAARGVVRKPVPGTPFPRDNQRALIISTGLMKVVSFT